ncbi:hypothetical protein FRC06_001796 [Ceratobasidium sp. 370]|nr:hypothetical protein FRC06_001796 [Ceratobasidium sp. 370]
MSASTEFERLMAIATAMGYSLTPMDVAPPYAPAATTAPAAIAVPAAPIASVTSTEPLKPSVCPRPKSHPVSDAPTQATQPNATQAATPTAPVTHLASAVSTGPVVPTASIASDVVAKTAGPTSRSLPAGQARASKRAASTGRVALTGGVAATARHTASSTVLRSTTPAEPHPPASLTPLQHQILTKELYELRGNLHHLCPGRGDYNLEVTYNLTPDAYWAIRESFKHALKQMPGVKVHKSVTKQRKGVIKQVIDVVAPVFPEFNIYKAEGHWLFEDFCQLILRNTSRKKGKEATPAVDEAPLDTPLDVPDEVMDDPATHNASNNIELVPKDAQGELVVPATSQEEVTPDALADDFTMLSFHPDENEKAETPTSTNILEGLASMPTQSSPPRIPSASKKALNPSATHVQCHAEVPPPINVSTTTSTATSTASSMSTATASSTVTYAGTPVHRPPGSPRAPRALLGANMLKQFEGIMGLPKEQQGEHFSTVFGNLIVKMAADNSARVLSVPNAGTSAHAPTSASVLEFESDTDSVDTDPLSDAPSLPGKSKPHETGTSRHGKQPVQACGWGGGQVSWGGGQASQGGGQAGQGGRGARGGQASRGAPDGAHATAQGRPSGSGAIKETAAIEHQDQGEGSKPRRSPRTTSASNQDAGKASATLKAASRRRH